MLLWQYNVNIGQFCNYFILFQPMEKRSTFRAGEGYCKKKLLRYYILMSTRRVQLMLTLHRVPALC